MRSISLILLAFAAFAWAEEPPAPLPLQLMRALFIYMHDGSTDSINTSRIDAEAGITFVDNGMNMVVGVKDTALPVDIYNVTFAKSSLWYCTSQIDSIIFKMVDAPASAPEPAPVSALNKRPVPNTIFRSRDR
jgi:hypothetical protein